MSHTEPTQGPPEKHSKPGKQQGKKTKRPPRLVPAPWFTHEACVIGTSDLQPREPKGE